MEGPEGNTIITRTGDKTTYRQDGTLKETLINGVTTKYGEDGQTVISSSTSTANYVTATVSLKGEVGAQYGVAINLIDGTFYFNTGAGLPGFTITPGKIVDSGGQVLDKNVVNGLLKEWSNSATFTPGARLEVIQSGKVIGLGPSVGFGMGAGSSYGHSVVNSNVIQQINTTFQQAGQAINNALGYGPEYDEQKKQEAQRIIDNGGFGP